MSAIQNRFNISLFSLGIILIVTSVLILFDPENASLIIRSILASTLLGFAIGAGIVFYILIETPRQFNMNNLLRYSFIVGSIVSILLFMFASVIGFGISYIPIIGPIQDAILDSLNHILTEYNLIVAPICFFIGIIIIYLSIRGKRLDPHLESQVTYTYNIIDSEKD